MPSFFSIPATLSIIFSKPSSPKSSCSFFSKSSPSESYSCPLTIFRNPGNSTVSSRASCGLYMRMKARRDSVFLTIICIFESLIGRKLHRDIGQFSASLMLLQKHIHQIGEFACLSKAREKKVLLQLLVVIFDETSN